MRIFAGRYALRPSGALLKYYLLFSDKPLPAQCHKKWAGATLPKDK